MLCRRKSKQNFKSSNICCYFKGWSLNEIGANCTIFVHSCVGCLFWYRLFLHYVWCHCNLRSIFHSDLSEGKSRESEPLYVFVCVVGCVSAFVFMYRGWCLDGAKVLMMHNFPQLHSPLRQTLPQVSLCPLSGKTFKTCSALFF